MSLQIGDLVRVRGEDWLGKRLGIVTEVKQLVHDPSGEGYTAITALVGTQSFTFSERDFELVKRVDKND
jgi:hypothetical protein